MRCARGAWRRSAYFLPTLPSGAPAAGSSTEWMLGSTPPAAMVTAGRGTWREQGREGAFKPRARVFGPWTHPCRAAWTAPRRCGSPAGCGAARCCARGGGERAARARARVAGRVRRQTLRENRCLLCGRAHAPRLLVVAAGVAGQLQHLGGQVLQHGGQVHRRAGTDAGGVLARLQVAGDAAHGELEARLGGAAHSLLGGLALAAARHGVEWCEEAERRRCVWRRGARPRARAPRTARGALSRC